MRKYLYLILVLQIIGAIAEFFILLSQSVILSVLLTPISLLGVIPTIAIIRNMDDIDDLRYEVNKLRYENNKSDVSSNDDFQLKISPSVSNKETARGTWECVKCGTVNK